MKKVNFIVLFVLVGALVLSACSASAVTPSLSSSDTISESAVFTGAKLNLNTVTKDELLATIPGFSSRMVREFQEYRPYVSIQQFRREIGKYVGDAQVAEYERYVYVPIAINDSDAATLQQIAGLDATAAHELIAARPFASPEDFLTQLGTYLSADELTIAQFYLGD